MKLAYIFLIIFSSIFSFIFQTDPFFELAEKFRKYSFNNYEEKIYLHLDRSVYTSGETVWFKANLANGITLQPDTISVPLYVELVDSKKAKVLVHEIVKLEAGFAKGHINIPNNLAPGQYQIRAYTQWMRNFGEEGFFKKSIQIGELPKVENVVVEKETIDFRFFPEGGQLVNGLNSRLAFKATNKYGYGVDVQGFILSKTGDTLVNFTSLHLGMGFCMFTPDIDEKYKVYVYHKNTLLENVQLPQIEKSGYTLLVDNRTSPKNVKVYINKSADLPAEKVGVIAQTRGEVYYAGQASMTQNSILITIPKENLPKGTAQITLFNEKGDPKCERLVYMHLNQSANATITADKSTYGQKDKVALEIQVASFDGKPLQGDFSMAVTDANQIENDRNEDTILSHLTLTSDVSGRVEQAGYYFDKTNTNAPAQLDILMLTQGWRRFTWQNVLQKEEAQTMYFFERGLSISGEVRTFAGKKIDKPYELSLIINDEGGQSDNGGFLTGATNDKGRFEFAGLDFKDNAEILLQIMSDKSKKNTSFVIDSLAYPKIEPEKHNGNFVPLQTAEFENFLKKTAETQKINIGKKSFETTLTEIEIKAKKTDMAREAKVLYKKENAVTLSVADNDRLQGFLDIFQLMKGRVAGVTISGSPTNPSVLIRGVSTLSLGTEPMYMIDGQPVDKTQMLNLLVTEVDVIDVLKGPANTSMYGDAARNGIISVITRTGSGKVDTNKEVDGTKVIIKKGYQQAKEFYSPTYEMDKQTTAPDYRATVYWNPTIKTNNEGKATVTFYTTSASGVLHVQLQGLSYTGEPVVGKMHIEVR